MVSDDCYVLVQIIVFIFSFTFKFVILYKGGDLTVFELSKYYRS